MGKYAQRIAGLFQNKKSLENIRLEGVSFKNDEEARKNFSVWWKRISIEHALVFWFIGALSILLLMLLSFVTTFGITENAQGIQFILHEGARIGLMLTPAFGTAFLFVVTVMLFQTQLGVMDSTSRIMAENTAIISLKRKKENSLPLSKYYFSFLWLQIAFGILLFLLGISEPKTLLVLGACLNAVAMFVHIGLVFVLNYRSLPKFFQAPLWRKILLGIIFIFFGFFSVLVLFDQIFKVLQ